MDKENKDFDMSALQDNEDVIIPGSSAPVDNTEHKDIDENSATQENEVSQTELSQDSFVMEDGPIGEFDKCPKDAQKEIVADEENSDNKALEDSDLLSNGEAVQEKNTESNTEESGSLPPRPPVKDPVKKSKAPIIVGVVIGLAVVLVGGYFALSHLGIIPNVLDREKPVNTNPPPVVSVTPTPSVEPEVTPTPEVQPTPTPAPTPTPEPTPEIIKGSGQVSVIGNTTITIKDEQEFSQEYFIPEKLEDKVADISVDSKVEFSYYVDGTDNVLESITVSMSVDVDEPDDNLEIAEPTPNIEDVFSDFKSELEIIAQREPKSDDVNSQTTNIPAGEKIETMELGMDVPNNGDIWFRFAWKKNDKTPIVPAVNDIVVELKSPSGSLITQENIGKYGRFWIEGNIINYALKDCKAGEWKFCVTKTASQNLGDISANILPLTGFIKVEKASVAYVGDDLHAIWKITGVKDEDFGITINAKNAEGSNILVYSGNSLDDGIQLIDTIKLSTSKLPAGVYDFEITVQDWDTKTVDGKKIITSKSMTDKSLLEGITIK